MKLPTAAALACAALCLPSAALADNDLVDAETVRELNMMLMATSLRCRDSRFDFRHEYERFSRYNLHHLNRAYDRMRSHFSVRYGEYRGLRELERRDASFANRYGSGHPWMNCAQLREAAIWLAKPLDQYELVDAALDLVYSQPYHDNGW